MGLVYADITLRNTFDEANAKRGFISESDIRQTALTAMVDTGAMRLTINEEVRLLLGLEITSKLQAELADGTLHKYGLTEPITVQWKDRTTICHALVLPNSTEVLLGVIPLEAMDLIVNPVSQELVGAHGDEIIEKVK